MDTWELDEHLRRAARLLDLCPGWDSGPPPTRIDLAQPIAAGWHQHESSQAHRWRRTGQSHSWSVVRVFGAVSTWLGTSAITCGAILMGWAAVASRPELQVVGYPIALCGAIALVAGLAISLDQNRLAARSPGPSPTRRVDLESSSPGSPPHPRRPVRHRAGKAA